MAAATIKNIETITIKGAHNVTADVSGSNITGLETISVLKSVNADVTAAATTDVNVSGTTGTVEVDGGKNVTVTDAKGIVTLDNAKGNVTVTDATQDTNIIINDGANVTVTATTTGTATVPSSGTIAIGGTNGGNTGNATGDVVVTVNLNSDGETDLAGGDITVTGGKTVTVTTNSTIVSTTKDANTPADKGDITNGAISITGDANTTTVTVKQNESVTEYTKAAVAEVKATTTVTFNEMKSGETLIINGLTFKASKDLTAEQVAAAFANLTDADTQSATGITANGYYSGTFNTAVWTSAAANGATVTFTAPTTAKTDLTFTGTATTNDTGARIPTQVSVAGKSAVPAEYSYDSVTLGQVVIADGATVDTIKTVTVDGYANSAAPGFATSSITSNALTDVTLKNSAGKMTISSTVASLNLTVDDIQDDVTFTTNLKTLNLTTTGDASEFDLLTATAVETLTIAAGADLTTDGSKLTAIKTVTISGTGDVTLGDITGNNTGADTLTALTSTTTGDVSATVAGTATVTTGAGNDSIIVNTATVTKAITLGAGDDRLDLTSFTTLNTDTATITGGEGTDTIFVTAAVAASASSSLENSNLFKSKVTGFEQLEITEAGTANDINDTVTINLENLGFNYVITNGTLSNTDNDDALSGDTLPDAEDDTLTLQNMANNGTVVLNAAGLVTVNVKDADKVANTTDVLNVVIADGGASTDFGVLTVANVETINITTTNTFNDVKGAFEKDGTTAKGDGKDDDASLAQLSLKAAAAKTVSITGAGDLELDSGSTLTAVTLIDASKMTGDLVVVSQNKTAASTIKGGSGDDVLTASTTGNPSVIDQVHTLIGGAGNDTLTANNGKSILTGGAGNDTFVINTASYTVDYASTITDLGSGDIIKFAGATSFVKLTDTPDLDGNPNLVQFANAAINEVGLNTMAWFQYNNNTYIVMDVEDDTVGHNNASTFTNGKDFIVKITGLVDLGTGASFNIDGTLEIA